MAPSSTLCWVSWRVSAKCLLARTISLCKWSDRLQVTSREQATHVPGTQVHGVGGVDDGVHMAPVGMLLHVADVPNLVSNAVGGTRGTRGRSRSWMTVAALCLKGATRRAKEVQSTGWRGSAAGDLSHELPRAEGTRGKTREGSSSRDASLHESLPRCLVVLPGTALVALWQ